MEDKLINEKESLEIISNMIATTRKKFERGGGRYFLIWGYSTLVVSLIVWFLISNYSSNLIHWLWFLIPVIGMSLVLTTGGRQKMNVKSHLDSMINNIWLGVGLIAVVTPLLTIFPQGHRLPVLLIEGVVVCIGLITTGVIIKSSITVIGGAFGVLLSYLTIFVHGSDTILIFAAMSLFSMIIPGHIMSVRNKK
jgi:hypothetical protein